MSSKNRTNVFLGSCKCVPWRVLYVLLAFSVMSIGCATFPQEHARGDYAQIVEGNPEIIIMELDVEENGEWCSDFTLTTSDVRYFFQHAREVTGPEYSALDWYPCSICGEIITTMRVYSWNINASGNGHVTHPDDKLHILQCETCLYGGE